MRVFAAASFWFLGSGFWFSTASAQDAKATAPPVATVVVPVVGSINGANDVRWKTDIELVNDFGTETTVSLMLPTAPEQPFLMTTIGPHESMRFADVIGEAFGIESALSPLVVSTMGRRSVTIRATVYGVRGTQIFPPQPITINYSSTGYPLRRLQGLSFSDDYRTNVGLVNLSEREIEFTIGLQRLPGRNVAITHIPVPANSLLHMSIQSLFPLITSGDDFSLVVETGAADTYVYASVIENATNSAKFVQGTVAAASLAAQ